MTGGPRPEPGEFSTPIFRFKANEPAAAGQKPPGRESREAGENCLTFLEETHTVDTGDEPKAIPPDPPACRTADLRTVPHAKLIEKTKGGAPRCTLVESRVTGLGPSLF